MQSGTSPSSGVSARPRIKSPLIWGLTVILAALNLRTLFSSLPVMLPEIAQDTGLSGAQLAYLTTLPLLCLGIFAPLAVASARRYGLDRSLLAALILLAVALALRGWTGTAMLYISTCAAGIGVAFGNVLLPALVKRDFPSHIGLMTGSYTMAICAGAALCAAVTLPMAQAFSGNWMLALAAWGMPALVAALAWWWQMPREHGTSTNRQARGANVWRHGIAWQLSVFMGLQSGFAFLGFGWLSPLLRERGVEPVEAGLVLATLILSQVLTCLIVPPIAVRCRDQRLLNVSVALLATMGLLGFLYAPLSMVWILAVIQGLGQGGLLAAALTMIVLRSADAPTASRLSGMAQSLGYVLASTIPWMVGNMHDWDNSYAWMAGLFITISTVLVVTGLGAGRNRRLGPE